MEDIIAQFVKLPPHVKTAVSSAQAIERLESIESRYNVKLADIVMRVAVKSLPVSALQAELERRLHVSADTSKQIAKDLTTRIFSQISGYLGFLVSASPDTALLSSPAHEHSLGIEGKDPEIEKHEANLAYAPQDTSYDVDRLVNQLIDLLGIGLDHVMEKRFKTLVESRLVDVRDKTMLKEQMIRSTKIGGMGFSQAQSIQILPIIEQAWEDIHKKHLKIKEEIEVHKHPAQALAPQIAKHPTIAQQHIETSTVTTKDEKPSESSKTEPISVPEKIITPPTPIVPPTQIIPPPIVPPIGPVPGKKEEVTAPENSPEKEEEMPLPKPKHDIPQFMPKVRRDFESSEKKMVQDIISPSKLVGPIEELQEMAVEDFRHLGDDPKESADRLKEKIHMLEKESFGRRSQGINALRSSPLMKEYLDIGRSSIENTRDIKQLIADRLAKNAQSMTSQEFDAISEVNSSLRY